MLHFLSMFAFYQENDANFDTVYIVQCTLSRLSLCHAVRRARSPSLHFTGASRDSLIIGIYLVRLSRQVLDKPKGCKMEYAP